MPLFNLIHDPSIKPATIDEIVKLLRPIGAVALRTSDHDLSQGDFKGYCTPSHHLGGLDALVVFSLEAYPERVERRDQIAGSMASAIMHDLGGNGLKINLRVQLELSQIGWSYFSYF